MSHNLSGLERPPLNIRAKLHTGWFYIVQAPYSKRFKIWCGEGDLNPEGVPGICKLRVFNLQALPECPNNHGMVHGWYAGLLRGSAQAWRRKRSPGRIWRENKKKRES
jgi:hypothetical protein